MKKRPAARPRPAPRPKPPRGAAPRTLAAPRAPRRKRPSTKAARQAQATEVYARLLHTYPHARCALDYQSPLQLLVATILSAQCTDKRVNLVTPTLFARYPSAGALAAARLEDVEELIKSTGFFRNKAKSIVGMANALVDAHDGDVPADMDALVQLPGVGRKTANVVLGNAFGRNEGIVVDTHVARVSARLGLTAETDPVRIEQDLLPLFPRDQWTMLAHLLIEHGRQICIARTPRCEVCPLSNICPSSRV